MWVCERTDWPFDAYHIERYATAFWHFNVTLHELVWC
jgi:hypothetical protein